MFFPENNFNDNEIKTTIEEINDFYFQKNNDFFFKFLMSHLYLKSLAFDNIENKSLESFDLILDTEITMEKNLFFMMLIILFY